MVERSLHMRQVTGSNPVNSTFMVGKNYLVTKNVIYNFLGQIALFILGILTAYLVRFFYKKLNKQKTQ